MFPEKYSLKTDEAEARRRLDAFWNRSSLGRPALAVTVRNPNFLPEPEPLLELPRETRELTPAWQAWTAKNMLHRFIYLAEAMPRAYPEAGSNLVLLTTQMGAGYAFLNETAWIDHRLDIFSQPIPGFDPTHPFVQGLLACLEEMTQEVGCQGYLSPPVMLDGLTSLSLLRGSAQLCLDLIEIPDTIIAWRDALSEMFIQAYEFFYEKLLQAGYGESCTWYQLMAPGRFEAVQSDFSVMISPMMFKRFVMPDLERVTEYLDYSLYHLDGIDQIRFFKHLSALPRLHGIQWNPEPGHEDPIPWLDTLKEIRQRGWCLLMNDNFCTSVEAAERITEAVGPDGLFLALPVFDTIPEAEAAIERIEKAAARFRDQQKHFMS